MGKAPPAQAYHLLDVVAERLEFGRLHQAGTTDPASLTLGEGGTAGGNRTASRAGDR